MNSVNPSAPVKPTYFIRSGAILDQEINQAAKKDSPVQGSDSRSKAGSLIRSGVVANDLVDASKVSAPSPRTNIL